MKQQIQPFNYNGSNLSTITDQQGEIWFVAKEVAEILEYSDAFEMIKRLDDDEKSNLPIAGLIGAGSSKGGGRGISVINESGLYSSILNCTKPEAKPFKKWVTSEVLPSIRKTGGYSQKNQPPAALDLPAKLFPSFFRVARLIGCDKNAAAISANQAVMATTGANVLALLGHTHLEAENQQAMYFTPTDLGERIGVSGRKFNMLLAEAGLQAKRGEYWVPLAAAEGFCRIMDTGKRHGDGTMIQQVKWADNVLSLVEKSAA